MDPFENQNLDKFEQDIEDSIDINNISTSPNAKAIEKKLIQAARNTRKKNKKISIGINEEDYESLKTRAAKSNIPVQTIIGSLIYKYIHNEITLTI